jgi:hypothetical protein
MNTRRRLWLILVGALLITSTMACSLGALLPGATPTPSPTPIIEPSPSMTGYWLDPDTNDVHSIDWQIDQYVVTGANSPSDSLTITSQSWTNGILTWTYLDQETGISVTFVTQSVGSDTLDTSWTNTKGDYGNETLQRVSSAVAPTVAAPTVNAAVGDMAGRWNDPDTTGTVTTIVAQGDGFTVESVINPNRGGNELTDTSWSNGVLTWTYCIPGGNCITSVTTGVNGDYLDTTWTDDRGYSGTTTFERLPADSTPAQANADGMAGRWNDPDTTGTVTTIVAEGDGYAVQSVINPNRGSNELTDTSWSNGVLTWTYCIPAGNCITSETLFQDGDSLYTTWTDDRGYSGTTIFERVP